MKGSTFIPLKSDRFKLIWLIYCILLAISFLTRIVLLIHSGNLMDLSFIDFVGIFSIGLLYDLINAGYFTIPYVLYFWILPERYFRKPLQWFYIFILFFVSIFHFAVSAIGEYFLWDEFGTSSRAKSTLRQPY
jgi:hypothetical protein